MNDELIVKDDIQTSENQEGEEQLLKAPEKAAEEEEENKNTPDNKINPDDVEKTLESQGFNYEELQKEYLENGDITQETREKLHKIGMSEDFINDFIEGKKAQNAQKVAQEQAELADFIGGKDTFDSVIKWAASNLSQEEIASINSIRDMTAAKLILQGLKSRMNDNEGTIPQFVNGSGQSFTEDIFESKEQVMEAIRDKRYKTDPAYVKKVTAKIQASRKAGVDLGF